MAPCCEMRVPCCETVSPNLSMRVPCCERVAPWFATIEEISLIVDDRILKPWDIDDNKDSWASVPPARTPGRGRPRSWGQGGPRAPRSLGPKGGIRGTQSRKGTWRGCTG